MSDSLFVPVRDDPARADRRAKLVIAALIAAGVVIRLAVVRAQGFPTDVGTFQAWSERLAAYGPSGFYAQGYFSDYPPGFLYVLWLLGGFLDGEALRLAIKAISIPADVAIAALAAALVWRAGRAAAVAAAGIWSLQPGPIFAGPYWGQVDAVGTLPVLGSLVAAGARRWWLAGALGALATLVKPQFGVALLVVLVAAAIEYVRGARVRPLALALGAAVATTYLLSVPFWGFDPSRIGTELALLVRSASETYPYTSLYAFNGWSVAFDFWKPDDALVVFGAVLLVAGLVASCVPLWWRRDTAMLIACAAFAAFAFYFLPTRAHERYLFPVFALALPFAATRRRVLVPYLVLAALFAVSLYFAFTRYQQYVDLRVPDVIEATLLSRAGQIAIALAMIGTALYMTWRLALRHDARLDGDISWTFFGRAFWGRTRTLPAGLGLGRLPTRRDVGAAVLVAVVVLLTRGYRLDWPRDMYFDEVYHARTAFELLAQREPYEWTHPHLAKEIMALGILAFGSDRVVAREAGVGDATLFAVTNEGVRVTASRDGTVFARDRAGRAGRVAKAAAEPRALAAQDERVVVATDREVCDVSLPLVGSFLVPGELAPFDHCADLPFAGAPRSLALVGMHVVVAMPAGVAIWSDLAAAPVLYAGEVTAITVKPDGTELYALDPSGVVHVIASDTGKETRSLTGGAPGTAIAYAQGPNRVFVSRADDPSLDFYELENGSHDRVALANARTGTFTSPVTALAVVARTDFLYALADGRVVEVETHGSSPFAAIPVSGRLLGVDGEDDKLLVAGAGGTELIETGRHAIAWRLPGVVFAALLAFFLVLLARRLFASPLVAGLVALAVILDGSMYAQARIGMNDIYVAALIVAGWYFVVAAHRPRRQAWRDIVIAGVLFGLAAAAKWAAAYALAGLLVATLAVTIRAYERGRAGSGGPLDLLAGRGRNAGLLFASFAVIPLGIYLASYLPWFGGPTIPYGWSLVEVTQQMYWYHSSLTSPHPAGSPWWSWPLVLKPVYWYFGQSGGGDNAYIYDAGNIVLFWGGLVAFVWCVRAAIRARSVALGFVAFAALAQYLAWIPIGRVLFFYHFFTALPFYLLALAAGLAYLWETRRERWVVAYVAVAAAAFVYFYPFVSAQPFPGSQAGMFFILPTWTYDCQFYPSFVCSPSGGSSFSVAAFGVRLGLALAVAAGVALLATASNSPGFSRILGARSGIPLRR